MRVHVRREQIPNTIALSKWRTAPSRLHVVDAVNSIFRVLILESRIAKLMAAKFGAGATEDRFSGGLHFDVAKRLQMIGHERNAGDEPGHRPECAVEGRDAVA